MSDIDPTQPTSPSVDAETLKSKVIEAADEQITAIHTAFGSPGDYGYESREGKALYELYKFQVELRAAIRQSLIDETRALSAPRVEPVAWRNPNSSVQPLALAYQKEDMRSEIAAAYSIPLYAHPAHPDAVREATTEMLRAGARSIGNTIHTDNHVARAKACWDAMWKAREGILEPVPEALSALPPDAGDRK